MTKIRKVRLPDLPTIGIFAFALASTWALYQFFTNAAIHPTPLYWIPAALVEVITAWLTKHAVEAVYQITRTKTSKQDRRFFWIVAIVSMALCAPTFAASIQANLFEFGGQFWLALLFPVAVIGCAIGAQIPRSVKHHNVAKDDESRAELRKTKKELRENKAELRNSRAELRSNRDSFVQIEDDMLNLRAGLEQACAEIEQAQAEVAQARADHDHMLSKYAQVLKDHSAELAQRAQMKNPTRAAYEQICAGLNGNLPTNAREVNRLLNDNDYYAAPDRTAASWIK